MIPNTNNIIIASSLVRKISIVRRPIAESSISNRRTIGGRVLPKLA
jgi:hypothetical protein